MDKARYSEISLLYNEGIRNDTQLLLNAQKKLNSIVFSNRDIVDSIFIHSRKNNVILTSTFFKYIDAGSIKESGEFSWIDSFYKGGKSLVWLKTRNTMIYSDVMRFNGDIITVVCSYPLSSTGEDMQGCVAVNLKEEALGQYLQRLNSASSGRLIVLDGEGTVISSSDKSLLYKDITNESFVKSILYDKSSKVFTSIYDNQEQAVSFMKSRYNDWYYISLVPVSVFYQRDFFIKQRIITMSIIILILVFFISNIFSFRIYNPFKKIIEKYAPSAMGGTASRNLNEYRLLDSMFSNMSSKINDLQETLDRNAVMIKHNFLVELLNNRLKGDQFEILYKLARVNFSRTYFCAVIFNTEKLISNSNGNGNDQLIKYSIIEYINSLDKKGIACCPVDISSTGITIIINTDMDDPGLIRQFIDETETFCHTNFGVYMPSGIGDFVESLKEMNRSYVNAMMSLQYKFIFPEKYTFYFSDIPEMSNTESTANYSLDGKFEKSLRLMNLHEIENMLEDYVRLVREKPVPYRQVRKTVSDLFNAFAQYLESMEVSIEELFDDSKKKELALPNNIDDFSRALLNAISTAFSYISNKKNCRNAEVVEIVKKYVINHLHMDISLNSAAEAVNISSYYLSKIFKEETGINYIDFVTKCKIDKAEELLETTNLSIEEITRKVGYNHITYFTRKFKELTGKTPGLYRNDITLKCNNQANR